MATMTDKTEALKAAKLQALQEGELIKAEAERLVDELKAAKEAFLKAKKELEDARKAFEAAKNNASLTDAEMDDLEKAVTKAAGEAKGKSAALKAVMDEILKVDNQRAGFASQVAALMNPVQPAVTVAAPAAAQNAVQPVAAAAAPAARAMPSMFAPLGAPAFARANAQPARQPASFIPQQAAAVAQPAAAPAAQAQQPAAAGNRQQRFDAMQAQFDEAQAALEETALRLADIEKQMAQNAAKFDEILALLKPEQEKIEQAATKVENAAKAQKDQGMPGVVFNYKPQNGHYYTDTPAKPQQGDESVASFNKRQAAKQNAQPGRFSQLVSTAIAKAGAMIAGLKAVKEETGAEQRQDPVFEAKQTINAYKADFSQQVQGYFTAAKDDIRTFTAHGIEARFAQLGTEEKQQLVEKIMAKAEAVMVELEPARGNGHPGQAVKNAMNDIFAVTVAEYEVERFKAEKNATATAEKTVAEIAVAHNDNTPKAKGGSLSAVLAAAEVGDNDKEEPAEEQVTEIDLEKEDFSAPMLFTREEKPVTKISALRQRMNQRMNDAFENSPALAYWAPSILKTSGAVAALVVAYNHLAVDPAGKMPPSNVASVTTGLSGTQQAKLPDMSGPINQALEANETAARAAADAAVYEGFSQAFEAEEKEKAEAKQEVTGPITGAPVEPVLEVPTKVSFNGKDNIQIVGTKVLTNGSDRGRD